jgi:hypothetical protein
MFMSDIEILQMALIGYEAERQKIGVTMAAIRSVLGGRSSAQATTPTGDVKHKRRKMSAAARERIGDAQRKRWAAARKATEPAPATSKPKRKLSRARKAALVANLAKARAARAAKRAEAAKAEKAASKKTAVRKAAVQKSVNDSPDEVIDLGITLAEVHHGRFGRGQIRSSHAETHRALSAPDPQSLELYGDLRVLQVVLGQPPVVVAGEVALNTFYSPAGTKAFEVQGGGEEGRDKHHDYPFRCRRRAAHRHFSLGDRFALGEMSNRQVLAEGRDSRLRIYATFARVLLKACLQKFRKFRLNSNKLAVFVTGTSLAPV